MIMVVLIGWVIGNRCFLLLMFFMFVCLGVVVCRCLLLVKGVLVLLVFWMIRMGMIGVSGMLEFFMLSSVRLFM